MPSPIGHGPVALRIKQRDFSPGKNLEEAEKRGKDGAIVRYQRKVADGLLHRIGRFFSDHAKGITKAHGTLCDRAPNNVPTHIMVRGQLLATKREDGTPSPAVDITLKSNRASGQASGSAQPHNLSRIREDLRFQIDVKGNKSDRAAMETFLKYATGDAAIPKQIKGNSQRSEMDTMIRQLKQFSDVFSELEQKNGLHAKDAEWVNQRLVELLDSAKNIQQADMPPHNDPVARLNLSASLAKSMGDFEILQASIKLPSPDTPASAKATPAAPPAPRIDGSGASPGLALPSGAVKGADVPATPAPKGADQAAEASGNIQLTDGLVKKLEAAFRQHGKELPKNPDPDKESDWDQVPDQRAEAPASIQLTDALTRKLQDALRQHGKELPKNYDPDKDSDWNI